MIVCEEIIIPVSQQCFSGKKSPTKNLQPTSTNQPSYHHHHRCFIKLQTTNHVPQTSPNYPHLTLWISLFLSCLCISSTSVRYAKLSLLTIAASSSGGNFGPPVDFLLLKRDLTLVVQGWGCPTARKVSVDEEASEDLGVWLEVPLEDDEELEDTGNRVMAPRESTFRRVMQREAFLLGRVSCKFMMVAASEARML